MCTVKPNWIGPKATIKTQAKTEIELSRIAWEEPIKLDCLEPIRYQLPVCKNGFLKSPLPSSVSSLKLIFSSRFLSSPPIEFNPTKVHKNWGKIWKFNKLKYGSLLITTTIANIGFPPFSFDLNLNTKVTTQGLKGPRIISWLPCNFLVALWSSWRIDKKSPY